ncbi:translation initiation factor IF-2B subunit delta [Planctomycetes bacterium Poly30]|uniref:Translation initiation factor eIF2B subunit beta n=1 Tax=Saltatorellus ferox TaxID=2528018 RepID=A0A518F166_9BACT|nr:translation initiation factor IF-2B subunit delta [Planctomycetes bacterium Poly30]
MTHADPEMSTFEWTPPGTTPPFDGEITPHVVGDLADDLLATLENRGLTAADLVRKVAREACDWLNDEGCDDAAVGHTLLHHELALLREAHGWRGPVARFLGALERVCGKVADDGSPALREALSAECALWQEVGSDLLPDRARCGAELLVTGAFHPAAGLESGEVILVHGWSETVARAVELAQAKGLVPEIIVSEGGPDLGGRRLARRLVASGLVVRFIYDAALVDAVKRVDRVWLGTEAIGQRAFVGRLGTRAVLERAQELDVPSAVLATSDKFTPDGSTAAPAWSEQEPWHLWEGAPHGVTVESQSFESIPLELAGVYATDEGLFGPQELTRRAVKSLVSASR